MDGNVVMGPSTIPDRTGTRKVEITSINLALQGGGSHGAFTWGVLDRLLQEITAGMLCIGAISGSSAGGINAALTVSGLLSGGPDIARPEAPLVPQSPACRPSRR